MLNRMIVKGDKVLHIDFTSPKPVKLDDESEILIDSMYVAVCKGMLGGLEVDDVLADIEPIHTIKGGDIIVKES